MNRRGFLKGIAAAATTALVPYKIGSAEALSLSNFTAPAAAPVQTAVRFVTYTLYFPDVAAGLDKGRIALPDDVDPEPVLQKVHDDVRTYVMGGGKFGE